MCMAHGHVHFSVRSTIFFSAPPWRAFDEFVPHRRRNDDSVIREQILLRENAIEQSDLLMEYKQLFVKHPSHHYAFKNNRGGMGGGQGKKKNSSDGSGSGGGGTGLLSIFSSLLAEPLSKTGSSRTSSDHLTIELVLHLIRNLLCISPLNTFGSTEKSQHACQLHRDLLVVLQEEMVLDVLVCVGQEVERRENCGYNLLLMEILSCLLKGQVCVVAPHECWRSLSFGPQLLCPRLALTTHDN